MNDPVSNIAMVSGMGRQAIIVFCSNNGVSYQQLWNWYVTNERMPTVAECQTIKNQ